MRGPGNPAGAVQLERSMSTVGRVEVFGVHTTPCIGCTEARNPAPWCYAFLYATCISPPQEGPRSVALSVCVCVCVCV